MPSTDVGTQVARPQAFDGDSRFRILLLGLILPILISCVNQVIFRLRVSNDPFTLSGSHAMFVIEVALISWCVGRYLQHTVLRVILFLWCIIFIDVSFVLLRFTSNHEFGAVGYSFASAQLGLLIVWAVLGTQPLGVRVFAALCGTTAVMLYVAGLSTGFVLNSNFGRNDWDVILTFQALATLALCVALRWRRFRIVGVARHEQASGASSSRGEAAGRAPQGERVQFSIFHVLMWTAGLAPIFAVARLVDWTAIEIPTVTRWAQFLSLAVLLSLAPLVAIWSGLGIGKVVLRVAVLLIFTAISGVLLAQATARRWLSLIDVGFHTYWFTPGDMIELYTFWVTWTVLAGFFYLALLLVLRASGHRLSRLSGSAAA